MKKQVFGRHEGRDVAQVVLESAQAAVSILNYGCVVRDWRVDVRGSALPMVLGFPRIEDYVRHSRSQGIIAGRVANRTANARFSLDGRTYELTPNKPPHHLHGGTLGLGRRLWDMETKSAANAVHLRYQSPNGEEGYPGAVAFEVTFRLEGATLLCEMRGLPDRPTPINLAQHSYYNLGGDPDILDHVLWIDAPEFTPVAPDLIPDGDNRSVEGTRYDFTTPRAIGAYDENERGIDNNLVLNPGRDTSDPAATVFSSRHGIRLKLWTEEPGIQVFNAPEMNIAVPGHEGRTYGAFCGLCLEAQHFPDSLNRPEWPSIIHSPEKQYFQRLAVEIS